MPNSNKTIKRMLDDFYPYAKEYLGFDKEASISFASDKDNAQNPLGKTAYYDPSNYSVTVYTDNRHPKDIMRSVSHELVHHTQNCRGDLGMSEHTGEGYAQNDEHLREMEREAYEKGNLCFRDWEDGVKANLNPATIYEQKTRRSTISMQNFKNLTENFQSYLNEEGEYKAGDKVKDLRNDTVGTVVEPMAGGVIMELEDGTIVKTRDKFLEKVEGEAMNEGGSMAEYGKIDAEDGNPPSKIGRGNPEYMEAYNAVLVARGEEPLDVQQPDQAYLDALRSGNLEEDNKEEYNGHLWENKIDKIVNAVLNEMSGDPVGPVEAQKVAELLQSLGFTLTRGGRNGLEDFLLSLEQSGDLNATPDTRRGAIAEYGDHEAQAQGGMVSSSHSSDPELDQIADIVRTVIEGGGGLHDLKQPLEAEAFDVQATNRFVIVKTTNGDIAIASSKNVELSGEEELIDTPYGQLAVGRINQSMEEGKWHPTGKTHTTGYQGWDSTSQLGRAMSGMSKEEFMEVLKDVQGQLGLSDEEMAQKIMKFVNDDEIEEAIGMQNIEKRRKPAAAPAGQKLSPAKMAMNFIAERGYDSSKIDMMELVGHLRSARAKSQEEVNTAVIDFIQKNNISMTEGAGDKEARIRNVVKMGSWDNIDGAPLSLPQAELLAAAMDNLNPTNKEKLMAMPIDKMLDIVNKMVDAGAITVNYGHAGLKEGESRHSTPDFFGSDEEKEMMKKMSNKEFYDYVTRDRHTVPDLKGDMGPMDGLEGPFQFKSGAVLYYDPKAGKYYDRGKDIYLDNEEASRLTMENDTMESDNNNSLREKVKTAVMSKLSEMFDDDDMYGDDDPYMAGLEAEFPWLKDKKSKRVAGDADAAMAAAAADAAAAGEFEVAPEEEEEDPTVMSETGDESLESTLRDRVAARLQDLAEAGGLDASSKSSSSDFKRAAYDASKRGSEGGVSSQERSLIQQVISILQDAAGETNLATGSTLKWLNVAMEKVQDAAKTGGDDEDNKEAGEETADVNEASTDKHDDDPALKGDQDELPDNLQKAIIDKDDDKDKKEESLAEEKDCPKCGKSPCACEEKEIEEMVKTDGRSPSDVELVDKVAELMTSDPEFRILSPFVDKFIQYSKSGGAVESSLEAAVPEWVAGKHLYAVVKKAKGGQVEENIAANPEDFYRQLRNESRVVNRKDWSESAKTKRTSILNERLMKVWFNK